MSTWDQSRLIVRSTKLIISAHIYVTSVLPTPQLENASSQHHWPTCIRSNLHIMDNGWTNNLPVHSGQQWAGHPLFVHWSYCEHQSLQFQSQSRPTPLESVMGQQRGENTVRKRQMKRDQKIRGSNKRRDNKRKIKRKRKGVLYTHKKPL